MVESTTLAAAAAWFGAAISMFTAGLGHVTSSIQKREDADDIIRGCAGIMARGFSESKAYLTYQDLFEKAHQISEKYPEHKKLKEYLLALSKKGSTNKQYVARAPEVEARIKKALES